MCSCRQEIPLSYHEPTRGIRATALIVELLLLSLPMLSQDNGTSNSTPLPVTVFGGGDRPRMSYAGDQNPRNMLLVTTGYEATYDDNPAGQNSSGQADEEQGLSNQVVVVHQSPRTNANLNYQSSLEYFHHYSQFNRFNQTLTADEQLTLSSHISVRLRDDLVATKGLYAPSGGDAVTSGIGSPTDLNSTIYTPLNNVRANTARADLMTQLSSLGSLDVFGAYATRTFSQDASSSYGTVTQNAGAEYVWRVNEHGSVGLLGVYQRIDLNGSLLQGSASRLQSGATLPAIAWKLRPTFEISLFAGPQFIRQVEADGVGSGVGSLPVQMKWAGGAGLVREGRWMSAMLSAEHAVTDGGGLLSFVSNSSVSGGVRKRVYHAWDLTIDYGYARNQWISSGASSALLTEQSGRATITRPLGRKIVLEVEYDFMEQMTNGNLSIGSAFHRNRVGSSLAWNWGAIRMGR